MSHKSIAARPSSRLFWDERPAKADSKRWPLSATVVFVVVFNALAWTGIVAAFSSVL